MFDVGSWDEELRKNVEAAETESNATDFQEYFVEDDESDEGFSLEEMFEIGNRFGVELETAASVCGVPVMELLRIQIETAEACEMPVCVAINQAFEQAIEAEVGEPRVRCPNCGGDIAENNDYDDGSHCLDCGARWSYAED